MLNNLNMGYTIVTFLIAVAPLFSQHWILAPVTLQTPEIQH